MMKNQKSLPILLLLALLIATVTGCSIQKSQDNLPKSEDATLRIKFAKNFNIEYMADGVKLVTDAEGRKLLLVPDGITAPTKYNNAVLVTTPITRAMYSSTVHISYLGALNHDFLYDSIVAVSTPREDWTTPQVLERFDNGQIKLVRQNMTAPGDIEQVMAIAPQLVFSGGGDARGAKQNAQFNTVGIDYAVVTDWLEVGAEASFEWIKFFAAFFNLDREADAIFEARVSQLNELKKLAMTVPADKRPVMAYVLVHRGTVYTQGGGSTLAREMEQAGCIYALKDVKGTGSIRITMEEFVNKCKDADVIIYGSLPQYCPDKATLLATEPLFAEFKAFKDDRIYALTQGYYMNSARIVEKFKDVLHMFQPDLAPGHELSVYRKLPDVLQ